MSDEALLERVASGDETALATLYDRYGGLAYGLAHRVLRDARLAEDAVQETFLGIWRSAAGFEHWRGSARTWILTVAHRRAVDLVRSEERRRWGPVEGIDEPAGEDAHDAAIRHVLRKDVLHALELLPEQQRKALVLAYYGVATQAQIAERLAEPLGTIKSRTSHGLARLRMLLPEKVSPPQPHRDAVG